MERKKDKISGLIGLAARAGALTYGARVTREEFDRGRIKLIILSSDCAAKTKKEVEYFTDGRVPVITAAFEGETAASLTGRPGRLSVIGVTDRNFARGMNEKNDNENNHENNNGKKNEESINPGGENSGDN